MKKLSRKCQYALQAIVELARRGGVQPVSAMAISGTLSISDRFLETIFAQLRRGGTVIAHRGRRGGYTLTNAPEDITVGSIIRLIDGRPLAADCRACGGDRVCPSQDSCAFANLWVQAANMVTALYDSATILDLLHGDFSPQRTAGQTEPPAIAATSPL